MMLRRLAACVLILALLGMGVGSQLGAGAARAASPLTLQVWLPDYCSPLTQNFFKDQFLPAFYKANPNITVKIVYVDWSVYDQKVTTAYAGNASPDVLQTGAQYVPNLVAKNEIRTIDPYLAAWGHKNDFYPGAWQNTVWQGHNYGVPYISGVRGIVYRKSLLKAAGISPEINTWDDLYKAAVKLTKHDASGKLIQLGFNPDPSYQGWLPFFEQAGGWPVTADYKHATVTTAAGYSATAFFVKLFQAMTPGGVGLSSKLVAPFESGKVAMEVQDSSISGEVLQYNPKILNDVGVLKPLLPATGTGKRVAIAYNDWLAISSQTKNPDAAWDWIAFATQPSWLGAYDRTCGEIPTNKLAVKASWVANNPIYKQFSANVFPYAVAHPNFPHMVEMGDKLTAELQKAEYGKESPKQAMDNVEAQTNAILGGTATH